MIPHSHFFSCDWGTTSMRMRLVETATERVLTEMEDADSGVRNAAGSIPENASHVERAARFQTVLAGLISKLPEADSAIASAAPVVVSGMASSSIGWKELPYAAVPFPVDGSGTRCEWLTVTVRSTTLPVLLVSGLATSTEMMRGEETQLIGLLAQPAHAHWASDSLVILPGTHSKHVRVQGGSVLSLKTFMTGELFDLLSRHSVLRFTTHSEAGVLDESAFLQGVESAKRHGLMASLFQVRTRSVLRGCPAAANRAFLSGLLLSAELGELVTDAEAPPVLLAASGSIGKLYALTAQHLGLTSGLHAPDPADVRRAVVQGHARLLSHFRP